MAAVMKRSWKLQEFEAHSAQVNCLALGHKSGRVMVTGGDDKKVNLWAVGKQGCFMSLSGHTTPVECVQFNHLEELVCAGSRAGALKVWDLEAARLVRTLNGHKCAIRCIDFHPYGDFLASGSVDSSIKIWDCRRKGCIYTYNGHKSTVNSIKFSPDGQWVATGGEDTTIKIWDLRVGRVLKEFTNHINAVTSVEFHPREFLLASGGSDRAVHIFDLEKFDLVSSERDLGVIRSLWFSPGGECLFAGVRDYLKVVGWEPNRQFDSVPVNWGKICDISTFENKLIGASYNMTNVMVYLVDLKKIQPFGSPTLDNPPSPFIPNQGIRKSFSKAERPASLKHRSSIDVKTIEESTSGTDPEEEPSADITNLTDYNEIFKGQGLSRTPPPRTPSPEPEPIVEPTKPQILAHVSIEPQILTKLPSESLEALSLDNNLNQRPSPPPPLPVLSPKSYSRSKSNLEQVYVRKRTKQDSEDILPVVQKPQSQNLYKMNLQRQSSCKETSEKVPVNNNIHHSVSDMNISKSIASSRVPSRKNSFSRPNRNSGVQNISKSLSLGRSSERVSMPKPMTLNTTPHVDIYVSPKISPETPSPEEEFVPTLVDRPVGLDMDDFLPKTYQTYGGHRQLPSMSEAEVLGALMRGHESMKTLLDTRLRSLKIVHAEYRNKDVKSATETAVAMNDLSVLVDLLGIFNTRYSLWNLDLCVLLLPKVHELLQSKFEMYTTTACNTLKLILRHFGQVIKTNVQSPAGSFGVDISREERYRKSVKCHDYLVDIKSFLIKKQSTRGTIGSIFREVTTLMENTFDQ